MKSPIYLDYNASTPIDQAVQNSVISHMSEHYGNPSALSHLFGMQSSVLLQTARQTIADFIGAHSCDSIVFTSGASESNTMVLRGLVDYFKINNKFEPIHIITSQIEHKCIINCCEYLKNFNVEITYLPVSSEGFISLDALKSSLRTETKLVSIMAANNETGVIQPIHEAAEITKNSGAFFHTDAAQAIGKIPFLSTDIQADFISFSSHKFYGPKGVGGLYCTVPTLLSQNPLIHGGGQELGLRGGSVNLPSIMGFAKAAEISKADILTEYERQKKLKTTFIATLKNSISDVSINGHEEMSLPNTINFSIPGVKAKELIKLLKNKLALATGSACSSDSGKISHVLSAMGIDTEIAETSIRLSFGKYSTLEELLVAMELLVESVKKLR